MYNIKTLNKIAKCGIAQLDPANYTVGDEVVNPDAIILRSFNMHEMELESNLKAIARAGAGVNNIPIDKCSEKGIVVFNTPGANANAVKELVMAALLISSRKIVEGIEWAKSLEAEGDNIGKAVEKGKSAFVGPEIMGKTLGVIGLGAIGVMVANAAAALGMNVIGYDPYISIDHAWGLSRNVKKAKTIKEIYENSDYITLHVPLTADTKESINKESISIMKDGVRILNFSRGELVNNDDLLAGIEEGKVAKYVTDFPNLKVINNDAIIPIPHLGASTPESEENCAVMAARELKEYLENGNIINSVNFPNATMDVSSNTRVCVAHKNIPNMLSQISATFAEKHINIENMLNKSKGDYAYTMLDVTSANDDVIGAIKGIDGILSVRVINF